MWMIKKGGRDWDKEEDGGEARWGERCWQLPKPSCLSRCQSNCCTLTTAQIRDPRYQTASAISNSHKTLLFFFFSPQLATSNSPTAAKQPWAILAGVGGGRGTAKQIVPQLTCFLIKMIKLIDNVPQYILEGCLITKIRCLKAASLRFQICDALQEEKQRTGVMAHRVGGGIQMATYPSLHHSLTISKMYYQGAITGENLEEGFKKTLCALM